MSRLHELTVLNGILGDPLIAAFAERDRGEQSETAFLRVLYARGAEEHFASYLADCILTDDNVFSRTSAADNEVSAYLRAAYIRDLSVIGASLPTNERRFCIGETPELFAGWDSACADRLADYYRTHGCGKFLKYHAFRYADGNLSPIALPSPVQLSDLKGYEDEKEQVSDNFENFVNGLPYADMLLYGDRGTGKSSTVHAMVNKYAARKLRLVEIAKENILELPHLKSVLAAIPMKFVVFIDDFSLQENDDRVSTLKAALQGSMEGHAGNVMIVATSNRRHIVEENYDSRINSIHRGDSEEELLSLSDRFGITVLFAACSKTAYLRIVSELAADRALTTPTDETEALAERWALVRGGRSPRRARQFVDYLYACEQKHRSPEL